LRATGLIANLASEEKTEIEKISDRGEFSVAFDPLDGSSLVETNLAVGAIFGIFRGKEFIGKSGDEMAAAAYFVFGPRTVFVFSLGAAVFEFILNELGEFSFSQKLEILPDAKTFSPGNLRAATENENYKKLVESWRNEKLTLRYSGGMVPDVHQIFAKKSGIFSYPGFSKFPRGKLRLLFECAPLAFLAEKSGGAAVDDFGKRILDLKIAEIHERTPIFIGSKNAVKNCVKVLRGS